MATRDRGGLPIAVHVASASPYEPHLVPATLDARFLPDLPWCLIGGRGEDSDGLDDLLMTQFGIEMIAANRWGREPAGSDRSGLPGHGAARLCPDLAPGIYEIAFTSTAVPS